ncbi:photosystem II biogenesis protein Psp29 [Leptolyngbya sp. PCC 6406]|uniref:photosystem II biogenesis protein Psp29 n=1 Tax=Leptolyngbya sp. PCC 6406 TaxID=1173264 RepID=UPI0002ABC409|nr:photosystem II biogenesis protein Psp29 [Leptolyngbya sp. PCC 6406]
MTNVPTVSDTKRAFYSYHNRPIASVYRRVIEELMVEMHLLRVNEDFVYDPVYALGIVTTFDRFMAGYRPEADEASIFAALCQANAGTADQYRRDAEVMVAEVSGRSLDALKAILISRSAEGADLLKGVLQGIADRDRFKYSRAFAIGLYTLIETVDAEILKDKEKLMELLKAVAESLPLSFDKLQKDVELYRSNLTKMEQAKIVMADILAADRKKREERAKAKADAASLPNDAVVTPSGEASNGNGDDSKP